MSAAEVNATVDNQAPRIIRVSPTARNRVEVWFDESIDANSARNLAAWALTNLANDQNMAIHSVIFDAKNADHVSLIVDDFEAYCGDVSYQLQALGPTHDLAANSSGGRANTLLNSPPISFILGESLTIKLGASGYEHLAIAVHDASIMPGLETWSHGSIWLGRDHDSSLRNMGLLRFEWRDAIAAASGVSDSNRIEDAAIVLRPDLADIDTFEFRRVLQAWFDHRGPDFNSHPVDPVSGRGGPTWQESERFVRAGNINNAAARTAGVEGDDPADYFSSNDTAFTPDVVASMAAVNEPFLASGAGVTDAFRFWFDNPGLDYGYALSLVPRAMRWKTVLNRWNKVIIIMVRFCNCAIVPAPMSRAFAGWIVFLPIVLKIEQREVTCWNLTSTLVVDDMNFDSGTRRRLVLF